MTPLRLGTRGSQLALWQANYIADRLRPVVEPRPVELLIIETDGDRIQDRSIASLGGFGAFTKSIQDALLDNRVDVAVHSLKDLPTIPVPDLELTATPTRGPTGDAFVSHKHSRFEDLQLGAVVGTSSLRRKAQLLNRRPDLRIVDLRGNVETRLRKLREQDLDAIVLAQAGLLRLGLNDAITEILDPTWMLPAVGQGAIGLECRATDSNTRYSVEAVNDPATWAAVRAERAMLWGLGGGCLVPIGSSTKVEDHLLTLRGAVLAPDGSRRIVDTHHGPTDQPLNVGAELAARLLSAGARELLNV
ncbi:MAG TPA: hydroxymethylbilane synthase [Gemmataceae bacterium]|jgi:hydroxymethylbilane synthase|nr:hydroxymethylbilane synthase [Gemmataceae bacterium]